MLHGPSHDMTIDNVIHTDASHWLDIVQQWRNDPITTIPTFLQFLLGERGQYRPISTINSSDIAIQSAVNICNKEANFLVQNVPQYIPQYHKMPVTIFFSGAIETQWQYQIRRKAPANREKYKRGTATRQSSGIYISSFRSKTSNKPKA